MTSSRGDISAASSSATVDSIADPIVMAGTSELGDKPSATEVADKDAEENSGAQYPSLSNSSESFAGNMDQLALRASEAEAGKVNISSSDEVTEPVTKVEEETIEQQADEEAPKSDAATDSNDRIDAISYSTDAVGIAEKAEPSTEGSASETPTSASLHDQMQDETHQAALAGRDAPTDQSKSVASDFSQQPTILDIETQAEQTVAPPPTLPTKDTPPRTPSKAPALQTSSLVRDVAPSHGPSTPAAQPQILLNRAALADPDDVAAVAHAFGRDSPSLRTSTDTPQRIATPSETMLAGVTKDQSESSSADVEKEAIRKGQQTEDAAESSRAATMNEKSGDGEQDRAPPSGGTSNGQGPPPATQASEELPFDFNRFLEQMKHRSAQPVGEYVRSFIKGFSKKPYRSQDQIKLIFDFLDFIAARMRECDIWRNLGDTDFENATEAMEKLVMNRLYPYTFTPAVQKEGRWAVQTDDLERDRVLRQRISLFGWLSEEHLDVPVGDHSRGFVEFSIQELLKINHYKAPRDKLICILNCCKVIFGMIRHLSTQESADNFIPVLIFVVLKANPEHLISNVEYISRFRNPDRLSSEAGYYLSSLMGAISFIETMDYSSLSNITQEEFEKRVEEALSKLPEPEPSSTAAAGSGAVVSEGSLLAPPTTPPPRGPQPPFNYPQHQRSVSATSVSAPSGPGEEAARPLPFTPVAASLAEDTRAFFLRTGEAARTGLSKPMGALGRLINEGIEGIRTPSNPESGASTERQNSPAPSPGAGPSGLTASTSRPKLFGGLFGSLDPARAGAAGYPGQQGGRRSMVSEEPVTPPTEQTLQEGFQPYPGAPAGQAPDAPPQFVRPDAPQRNYSNDGTILDVRTAARRNSMAASEGIERDQHAANYYDENDEDGDDMNAPSFSNSAAVEQQRRRMQMQRDSGRDSGDSTIAGTPSRRNGQNQGRLQAGRREEIAHEQAQTEQAIHRSLIDQARSEAVHVDEAAQNSASLETLKSIFPTMEDGVIQMVLQGCEGNVETAIDRLLEMQ